MDERILSNLEKYISAAARQEILERSSKISNPNGFTLMGVAAEAKQAMSQALDAILDKALKIAEKDGISAAERYIESLWK